MDQSKNHPIGIHWLVVVEVKRTNKSGEKLLVICEATNPKLKDSNQIFRSFAMGSAGMHRFFESLQLNFDPNNPKKAVGKRFLAKLGEGKNGFINIEKILEVAN